MTDFQRIAPDTAAQLLDADAAVVDIRDPHSYQAGHISGALHLDNDTVQQFVASADRQRPLVVCCYHGNSSQQAAAWLASVGFAEVYSLDGGFELWQQQFPSRVSRD
ncbi:thiosulfate sulfurtransferase GlpE [Pseudomonas sp. MYb185]|uniref:thiosulfate sulfurtransferase GlpE n=1 Tax=Pseudomonas sp. MYb185 TaxID=1848729 RepID=UPI000CFBE8A8|nr:thiosulfate sulfurtransferase GlpE [Pseudomonas sp. MYb185]PRB80847.1 thiosulfate sulfurtransferase GlpE [Pseudomonas sp. MYb185]